MRNVMNRAKRRQEKPDFITADNWAEIKRIWDTEKHQQISEINKKNRASSSSEGSATYAGVSINIGEHRKRMADELGTEPTFMATFERTFQKKDKTWTGNRAKVIKDKYDELVMSTAAASGDGDGDGDGDSVCCVRAIGCDMALWMEIEKSNEETPITASRTIEYKRDLSIRRILEKVIVEARHHYHERLDGWFIQDLELSLQLQIIFKNAGLAPNDVNSPQT
ncbi:uncharacterized protein LOC130140114 [Syzygium oleosum]|uniref:uncharacterized protein LOC130140114 n=1 Tax=Syzygium oleosum TaxID=219896 RepID=UPI0024BBE11B|nr:uncharacterized protein LOC130140114 [Syzygium oleosum]